MLIAVDDRRVVGVGPFADLRTGVFQNRGECPRYLSLCRRHLFNLRTARTADRGVSIRKRLNRTVSCSLTISSYNLEKGVRAVRKQV